MTTLTRFSPQASWRALAAALAAFTLLLLAPAAAHAHVTVSPTTAPADSYMVLTFAVPHGCEGEPTTELTIKMPEGVSAVTPTVTPGWRVSTTTAQPDTSAGDDNGAITGRVDTVVYTADTPLPDNLRAAFEVSLRLPNTPDETIAFPVVQTCGEVETEWIEQADDPDAALAYPAPVVALAAAGQSGATGAGNGNAGTSSGWLWLAIGLGGLGTALGVTALARGGRSS